MKFVSLEDIGRYPKRLKYVLSSDMPLTWLPFPASRNFMNSCHVALWEATVMTVDLSGKILAGKQGRERKRRKKMKMK